MRRKIASPGVEARQQTIVPVLVFAIDFVGILLRRKQPQIFISWNFPEIQLKRVRTTKKTSDLKKRMDSSGFFSTRLSAVPEF
jgi:hypothetical protein